MNRIIVILLSVLALSTVLKAQVPRTFGYQADLRRNGVSVPDGIYPVTISLYSLSGSLVYREAQSVTVVRNIAPVIVGSVVPIPQSISFDSSYSIGIGIHGEAELPRAGLSSVAYALHSGLASSLSSMASIPVSIRPKSITISGPASGDLSGNYPNPAVSRLQGVPVSSEKPVLGDALVFDGTQWTPTKYDVSVGFDYGGEFAITRAGVYQFDMYCSIGASQSYDEYQDTATIYAGLRVNGDTVNITAYQFRLIENLFEKHDEGIRLHYTTLITLREHDVVHPYLKTPPQSWEYTFSLNDFHCSAFKVR